MNRKLVVYFSAGGVTKKTAENLSKAIGADLFEIKPEVPYTPKDLNWRDKTARSTIEMHDLNFRPAITGECEKIAEFDVIFVGFPIWWYIAPTIINTFLEKYDLSGKTIVPFATSGGSGMGETNKKLQPSCPNSKLLEGKILNRASEAELIIWVENLKLGC
ncbi:MAG TPA: flavodoxin [Bacillota bacterium]|nr:flavodoxin [Bacillota bacterium]